jgi:hypothetical protein
MKLKPDFDDEFQPKGQMRSWPVHPIGWLLVVAAACAIVCSVTAGMEKRRKSSRYFYPRVKRPVQVPQVNAGLPQPRDPFVVMATAEIDAKMVVAAPAGIDEAMVFNPDSQQRQQALDAADPEGALVPIPGGEPGPVPGYFYPRLEPAPVRPR